MEDQSPVLSIVIPAYNVSAYIRQAVESALDQSVRDIEVIVVEDGSTDDTFTMLDQVRSERSDPRLILIRQNNAGLSAARNTGIRHARGSFIGFLDGDDAWGPAKAERHLAVMDNDASIAITYSHSICIGEDGAATGYKLEPARPEMTLHDLIRSNQFGNGSTPVVRRDCFMKAGVFRENLKSCEDYDMWCRILSLKGFRAVLVPESLTLYRIRPDSLSFNFEKFLRSADEIMRLLREEAPGVPERVLREGHAEHYRIAAWKAATTRRRLLGLRYMATALRLCPWFFLLDFRVAGTLSAIVLPRSGLSVAQAVVKATRGRIARFRKRRTSEYGKVSV